MIVPAIVMAVAATAQWKEIPPRELRILNNDR